MWKKIIAPVLLVSILWVLFSGGTSYYRSQLISSQSGVVTENVASISAAGEMLKSLLNLEAAFPGGMDDEESPQRKNDVAEIEAQFERSLLSAEQAAFTNAEKPLVRTIRQRFSDYRDQVDRRLAHGPVSQLEAGEMARRSAQMAHAVAEPCVDLLQLNERLMTEAVARRSGMENSLSAIRLIFLVVGPVLGVYVGWRIATGLHNSISQISVTLRDASGELDQDVGAVKISPTFDDGELSVLNQQVQLIARRIRQILTELQHSRQETVRAERLAVVGELAAGVAHEMRNPLTSVKLLVQMAPMSDAGILLNQRQAHVIMHEISRLEETIQGLLDFARPPQIRRVQHDLRDTLRRAMNLVGGRALHEGVAIVSHLSANPLPIDADPEQIHQVFLNLLINGIDAMQSAGTLDVSASLCDSDPGRCQVIVADRGNGIPPELLSRIFEPFVTTKERGTGLGLAVSSRIIREHGGSLTASNRPEGGTLFTIELPLARPCSSHENEPDLSERLVAQTNGVYEGLANVEGGGIGKTPGD